MAADARRLVNIVVNVIGDAAAKIQGIATELGNVSTVLASTTASLSGASTGLQSFVNSLEKIKTNVPDMGTFAKDAAKLSKIDGTKLAAFIESAKGFKDVKASSSFTTLTAGITALSGVSRLPDISKFAESLVVLNSAMKGMPVSQILALSNALAAFQGVKIPSPTKITSFSTGLAALAAVDTSSINPSKLSTISTAVSTFSGISGLPTASKLVGFAAGIKALSKATVSTSNIKNLESLAALLPKFTGVSTGLPTGSRLIDFAKGVKKVAEVQIPSADKYTGFSDAIRSFSGIKGLPDLTKFSKGLATIQKVDVSGIGTIVKAVNSLASALQNLSAIAPNLSVFTRMAAGSQAAAASMSATAAATRAAAAAAAASTAPTQQAAQAQAQLAPATTQSANAFTRLRKAIDNYVKYRLIADNIILLKEAMVAGRDAIIDYDQSLKDLQAITGASSLEVGLMGSKILEVAASTKFSASEVAAGMRTLGQAGFSASESIQSMQAVSDLATGTLSDMSTTVDLVTTALRVFRIDVAESARVGDVFANAVNKSKLTIDKLRIAMNYVGPIARDVGITLEEMSAAMMTLANSGLRASTIGTGLRRVFAELANPTDKLAAAAKRAGVSLQDIDPQTNSLSSVVKNLGIVVADTSLAFELFGKRGAASILALSSEGNTFDAMLSTVSKSGTASAMAATQMEGLGVAAKNLRDRLGVLAIAIGDLGVTDAMRFLIAVVKNVIIVLTKIVQAPLTEFIVKLGVLTVAVLATTAAFNLFNSSLTLSALSGFGTAIAGIATRFRVVRTAVTATTTAVTGLKAAFAGLLLNPYFLAIAAGALVVMSLVNAFGRAAEVMKTTSEEAAKLSSLNSQFSAYALNVVTMKEGSSELKDANLALRASLVETASGMSEVSMEARVAADSINPLTGAITDQGVALAKYNEALGEELLSKLAESANAAAASVKGSTNIIASSYNVTASSLKNFSVWVGNSFVAIAESLDFDPYTNSLATLKRGLDEYASDSGIASAAYAFAMQMDSGVAKFKDISDYVNSLEPAAKLDDQNKKIIEIFNGMDETYKKLLDQLLSSGQVAMDQTTDSILKTLQKLNLSEEVIDGVLTKFKELKEASAADFSGPIEKWAKDIKDGKKDLEGLVSLVAESGGKVDPGDSKEASTLLAEQKQIHADLLTLEKETNDALAKEGADKNAIYARYAKQNTDLKAKFMVISAKLSQNETVQMGKALEDRRIKLEQDLARNAVLHEDNIKAFEEHKASILDIYAKDVLKITNVIVDPDSIIKAYAESKDAATTAYKQLMLDIEILEANGTLTHELAEERKLQATLDHYHGAELAAEETYAKLQALHEKDGTVTNTQFTKAKAEIEERKRARISAEVKLIAAVRSEYKKGEKAVQETQDKIDAIHMKSAEKRAAIEQQTMNEAEKYFDNRRRAEEAFATASRLAAKAELLDGEAKNKLLEKSNEFYEKGLQYSEKLTVNAKKGMLADLSKRDQSRAVTTYEERVVQNLTSEKSDEEAKLAVWEKIRDEVEAAQKAVGMLSSAQQVNIGVSVTAPTLEEDVKEISQRVTDASGEVSVDVSVNAESADKGISEVRSNIALLGADWSELWTEGAAEADSVISALQKRLDTMLSDVKIDISLTSSDGKGAKKPVNSVLDDIVKTFDDMHTYDTSLVVDTKEATDKLSASSAFVDEVISKTEYSKTILGSLKAPLQELTEMLSAIAKPVVDIVLTYSAAAFKAVSDLSEDWNGINDKTVTIDVRIQGQELFDEFNAKLDSMLAKLDAISNKPIEDGSVKQEAVKQVQETAPPEPPEPPPTVPASQVPLIDAPGFDATIVTVTDFLKKAKEWNIEMIANRQNEIDASARVVIALGKEKEAYDAIKEVVSSTAQLNVGKTENTQIKDTLAAKGDNTPTANVLYKFDEEKANLEDIDRIWNTHLSNKLQVEEALKKATAERVASVQFLEMEQELSQVPIFNAKKAREQEELSLIDVKIAAIKKLQEEYAALAGHELDNSAYQIYNSEILALEQERKSIAIERASAEKSLQEQRAIIGAELAALQSEKGALQSDVTTNGEFTDVSDTQKQYSIYAAASEDRIALKKAEVAELERIEREFSDNAFSNNVVLVNSDVTFDTKKIEKGILGVKSKVSLLGTDWERLWVEGAAEADKVITDLQERIKETVSDIGLNVSITASDGSNAKKPVFSMLDDVAEAYDSIGSEEKTLEVDTKEATDKLTISAILADTVTSKVFGSKEAVDDLRVPLQELTDMVEVLTKPVVDLIVNYSATAFRAVSNLANDWKGLRSKSITLDVSVKGQEVFDAFNDKLDSMLTKLDTLSSKPTTQDTAPSTASTKKPTIQSKKSLPISSTEVEEIPIITAPGYNEALASVTAFLNKAKDWSAEMIANRQDELEAAMAILTALEKEKKAYEDVAAAAASIPKELAVLGLGVDGLPKVAPTTPVSSAPTLDKTDEERKAVEKAKALWEAHEKNKEQSEASLTQATIKRVETQQALELKQANRQMSAYAVKKASDEEELQLIDLKIAKTKKLLNEYVTLNGADSTDNKYKSYNAEIATLEEQRRAVIIARADAEKTLQEQRVLLDAETAALQAERKALYAGIGAREDSDEKFSDVNRLKEQRETEIAASEARIALKNYELGELVRLEGESSNNVIAKRNELLEETIALDSEGLEHEKAVASMRLEIIGESWRRNAETIEEYRAAVEEAYELDIMSAKEYSDRLLLASDDALGGLMLGLERALDGMRTNAEIMADIGAQIPERMADGFMSMFEGAMKSSEDAKQAVIDWARTTLLWIARVIAQQLILKAIEAGISSFGGGGSVGSTATSGITSGIGNTTVGAFSAHLAGGGRVPGFSPSPTSDNIPAWLTAEEFVQPVKSVRHYGTAFMESIRTLRFPKELTSSFVPSVFSNIPRSNRLAEGGMPAFGNETVVKTGDVNLKIANIIDKGMIGDFLKTSDGEKSIMNLIRRNSSSIKAIVRN